MIKTVKYTGKSGNNFTNGQLYQVIQIDEDGDYILYDDYRNLINEYKERFEIIK